MSKTLSFDTRVLPGAIRGRRGKVLAGCIVLSGLVAGVALAGPAGTAGGVTADSAAAASAAVSADVPRIVVHYDPKSLATDAGVQTLYRRIVQAAVEVCPAPGTSLFLGSAVRACRAQAVARAVRAIDSPQLAALYQASQKQG